MTDLSDMTDSVRRAVATPGVFATLFPDTTDDDLVGTLADAFAECQLDGFFIKNAYPAVLDVDASTVTPDLQPGHQALVVIYATIRFLRADLVNRNNVQRYQAGTAVYETQQNVTLLVEILKELTDRKKQILTQAQTYNAGVAFHMADQAFIRATVDYGPLAMWESASLVNYFDPLGR